MRRDPSFKTGGLAGASEFTVAAPIRRGLVPALDAVSYKTRVKRVLRTLHLGRTAAHEHELARLLSDAVERVGRIHSVAIRVLESTDPLRTPDHVVLSVTFDGSWESYVRVIWQKVARLLDLIFHNTEGYVPGWENSYSRWGEWLRQHQTETAFLYATPGLTVADTRYLRMAEYLQRRDDPNAVAPLPDRLVIPSAEDLAELGIFADVDGLAGLDPTNPAHSQRVDAALVDRAPFRHGLRSLVGLHRLVEWHPPGTPDHEVLHRAAHELLPEFVRMADPLKAEFQTGLARGRLRFDEAISWLQTPLPALPARQPPALPTATTPELDQPAQVQGGLVEAYPDIDHGCLVLLAFQTPAALAAWLAAVQSGVSTAATELAPDGIAVNLAFTVQGLRLAGLTDSDLAQFPEEFVQGMAARAGWLGDLRINHPRRWRLPARNWADGVNATDPAENDAVPRVELDAVHAVLQLRHRRAAGEPAAVAVVRQQLLGQVNQLLAGHAGVQPLSLQWMHRLHDATGQSTEHFGFMDGQSDPVFHGGGKGNRYDNRALLGEVLLGYPHRAEPAPPPEDELKRKLPLRNGSFLVVRKLRQDLGVLNQVLSSAQQDLALSRRRALAKMMGRWPGGTVQPGEGLPGEPLADPPPPAARPNDFNYVRDRSGERCPLHAHVRRANPREFDVPAGSRPPRLVRRGLSYGPAYDAATEGSLEQERGLVFMACNASIGEQFEVVQRWLAGGNSSGGHSGQSDPFLGLAEPGRKRVFRFADGNATCRMLLDGDDAVTADPRPLVRLEWGAYFFVPSLPALERLHQIAAGTGVAVEWDASRGENLIAALRALQAGQGDAAAFAAWKQLLEDPDAAADFSAASVWAAIRENHGGALRTPYGVLVADRARVLAMLTDADRCLTATGYLPRMRRSFGGIYLGMDAGQEDGAYERESVPCNNAIMDLMDWRDAQGLGGPFEAARARTHSALQALVTQAEDQAVQDNETTWELTLDARELIDPLLAYFCEAWFGLSEAGGLFRRSGLRWDWRAGDPPLYPGHFMAPSRYFFQPHPGPTVEATGADHGQALLDAMRRFLAAQGAAIAAPVARAVLDAKLDTQHHDYSARTLVGALMGFVPTVDGNLRRVLGEWLREGTLWSLRARHAGQTPAADLQAARTRLDADFMAAMRLRAAPELLWRRATVAHTLGQGADAVSIQPGDLLVAGLVSATQQALAADDAVAARDAADPGPALHPAFGGDRWATGPRPTHACPGAPAALAMMYGFFSALVESDLQLQPGPGGLGLALRGVVSAERLRAPEPEAADQAALVFKATAFKLEAPVVRQPALMRIGDSWLSTQYRFLGARSLATALADRGFDLDTAFGSIGDYLQVLASDASLARIGQLLDNPVSGTPVAVLLGGGGNDLVQPTSDAPSKTQLYSLLVANATTLGTALDPAAVDRFVDVKLRGFYIRIIDQLLDRRPDIPVLVHAYDNPVPDGRGSTYLTFKAGPWMMRIFDARGIATLPLRQEIMAYLIGRLYTMLNSLAADQYPGNLHVIPLRGVLATHGGNDHTQLWRDELHPNETGFNLLADEVVVVLRALHLVA